MSDDEDIYGDLSPEELEAKQKRREAAQRRLLRQLSKLEPGYAKFSIVRQKLIRLENDWEYEGD